MFSPALACLFVDWLVCLLPSQKGNVFIVVDLSVCWMVG